MTDLAISVMLAVPDTPAAVAWYERALGARVLCSLGSVAGLEIAGAPFFLHEPVEGRFQSPATLGATGKEVRDHAVSWGTHRQGGFVDPFGHVWQVGDRSPLSRWPPAAGAPSGGR